MLRPLCSRSRLNIVRMKILPKLIYRLKAIPVKFPAVFLQNLTSWDHWVPIWPVFLSFLLQLCEWVPNIMRRLLKMHIMFYFFFSIWTVGIEELCSPFPQEIRIFIHPLGYYWRHTVCNYSMGYTTMYTSTHAWTESRKKFPSLKELTIQWEYRQLKNEQ